MVLLKIGGIIMQTHETLPEIRKVVVLNAPIEKVWKAVSTSDGIAAWWMPNTFEPILGHNFTLHSGQYGDSPCKITELDPPNRVGFDWDKGWHLVFELKKLEDGKTEFTLIHSGWKDAQKATRGIMDGGWEKIVKIMLPKYIEA
jgi:uncharacterized protein YndB with AHSA1/START domain